MHILFSFKGRINRKTFWTFFLGYCGFFISLFFLADIGVIDPFRDYVTFVVIVIIFILFCAYIQISIIVKRLHDTNRSGLNILWYITPMTLSGWFSNSFSSLSRLFCFVGILYLLIVCGITKGTPGPNKYGESPRYRI